jgi:hypothetical protein
MFGKLGVLIANHGVAAREREARREATTGKHA